jgi:hypothetical protein
LKGERGDGECRDISDEGSLDEKWWEMERMGEINLHVRGWL